MSQVSLLSMESLQLIESKGNNVSEGDGEPAGNFSKMVEQHIIDPRQKKSYQGNILPSSDKVAIKGEEEVVKSVDEPVVIEEPDSIDDEAHESSQVLLNAETDESEVSLGTRWNGDTPINPEQILTVLDKSERFEVPVVPAPKLKEFDFGEQPVTDKEPPKSVDEQVEELIHFAKTYKELAKDEKAFITNDISKDIKQAVLSEKANQGAVLSEQLVSQSIDENVELDQQGVKLNQINQPLEKQISQDVKLNLSVEKSLQEASGKEGAISQLQQLIVNEGDKASETEEVDTESISDEQLKTEIVLNKKQQSIEVSDEASITKKAKTSENINLINSPVTDVENSQIIRQKTNQLSAEENIHTQAAVNVISKKPEDLSPAINQLLDSEEQSTDFEQLDLASGEEKNESGTAKQEAKQALEQLANKQVNSREMLKTIPFTMQAEATAQEVESQLHEQHIINQEVANKATQIQDDLVKKQPVKLTEAIALHRKDFAVNLKDKVMVMVSQKLQQADIKLDPPELGNIHVRVNMQNDQAVVNFVVQHQQAKDALEQNVTRLKEMLSDSGVNVGDANIEQRQQQQDGSAWQQGSQQAQNDLALEDDKMLELDHDKSSYLLKGSSVGVDYYA